MYGCMSLQDLANIVVAAERAILSSAVEVPYQMRRIMPYIGDPVVALWVPRR